MGIINWLPQVEDERYYDPHFAPSIDIIVIAPISRIVNFGSSRITCTDSWLMGLPYYILPTTITFVVKRGSNYYKTCGFPRYGKLLSVFKKKVQNLRHVSVITVRCMYSTTYKACAYLSILCRSLRFLDFFDHSLWFFVLSRGIQDCRLYRQILFYHFIIDKLCTIVLFIAFVLCVLCVLSVKLPLLSCPMIFVNRRRLRFASFLPLILA